MDYTQVVAAIAPGLQQVPLAGNHPAGIDADVQKPDQFVTPPLRTLEGDLHNADVLLISAPAAVGKTWLARALAHDTENPLLDLSQFNVGSNFFNGTLLKGYGTGLWDAIDRLHASGGALIVDATDEALVRAGLPNFVQCLSDLNELFTERLSEKVGAVILGRPESIEFAGATLLDLGMKIAVVGVEFFTETQSKSFLTEKAKALVASRGAVASDSTVDHFVETVTTALAGTLASDSDPDAARSFLGYSPVLDALAEVADEGNLYGVVEGMKGERSREFAWEFLFRVVTGLLARERSKFASSFGGTGPHREARSQAATDIFSDAFQLSALTQDLDIVEVPTTLYDGEPWRGELNEALRSQLRDHPFIRNPGQRPSATVNPLARIRNVTFRDYLGVWALTHESADIRRRVANWYSSESISPSPLLARMLMAWNREMPSLYMDALAALVDSASTGVGEDKLATDIEQQYSLPSAVTLSFTAPQGMVRDFRLESAGSDGILLGRVCSDLRCVVPDLTVSLGIGGRDFSLGPNVFLDCAVLSSNADTVRVPDGAANVILAGSVRGLTKEIVAISDSDLVVSSGAAKYPWVRYRAGERKDGKKDQELLYRACMELRSVQSWFSKKSMKGRYRYPVKAMDAIRGKGRVATRMFDYLLGLGAIRRVSEEYFFEEPAMAKSISSCNIEDPQLHDFLESYIRATRDA